MVRQPPFSLITYEWTFTDLWIDQTFGVDLEARARADRKRVPIIVTSVLTYLDNRKYRID